MDQRKNLAIFFYCRKISSSCTVDRINSELLYHMYNTILWRNNSRKKWILNFHWEYSFRGSLNPNKWFLENVCMSIARSSVLTTEVLTTKPIFIEFKVNTEAYFIKSTCLHKNRLWIVLKTNPYFVKKPPNISLYKTRLQRRLDQTCVKKMGILVIYVVVYNSTHKKLLIKSC